MLAFSISTFAQASATASASAFIVTPISIANTVDMDFGNVAVASTGGTVVLATDGTRTSTGGVTLPVIAGTVTAATFTVTGNPAYTYGITLPSADVTISNGTENMIVNTFTSDPSGTGTLTGGTETLRVGATLNVNANQDPGAYTTATEFTVTVNYN